MDIDEILLHIVHIIVTPSQLSILTSIVDANEQGSFGAMRPTQIKGCRSYIEWP